MKNLIVVLIFFILKFNTVLSQENIKPQEFGLSLNHGQVDSKKMTKRQMDTIVVCPINYEDQLPDICICSNSKNEITIYRCLGNGMYEFYKNIPLQKKAYKIEPTLPKNYPVYFSPFYDLKVTYTDNIEQTIYNRKINSFKEQQEPRVPKWDFLNDASVFIYDFSFIKVWQSERNGQPQSTVALGDIDNDGRNEMVYTLFPINDSIPQYKPAILLIFESIGKNKFRIDWDTILTEGGGNLATHLLTDFDRNGKKEFFGASRDPIFSRGTYGLFECSGEGKYRFWGIDEFNFKGDITDVVYYDTMNIIDTTKNPGVWLNYYPSGYPPNIYDRISPYIYSRKYEVFGFGHYEFNTLPGSAVNYIRIPWQIEDIDVADIDRDGQNEIVLGSYAAATNFIDYMDSTGVSANIGYEYETIIPGVPLSGGWIFTKDFDNDRYNEIISCGIGYASGSIGVVKHTGLPGENNFTTIWWDTVGLIAQPNWGIDSATVNDKFTILYPTVKYMGPRDIENINTFARDGVYNFYKSSLTILDTTGFIEAKFFDIDKDNQMDIITPVGYGLPPIKQFLGVFKMKDIITHSSSNSVSTISTFKLSQNYPNPFNPVTKINYYISVLSEVKIKVYDILGKELQTLIEQMQNQGSYEVKFNGSDYSSGIYFYSLIVNGNVIDKKTMIYLK